LITWLLGVSFTLSPSLSDFMALADHICI
jgi:hypothetical protein